MLELLLPVQLTQYVLWLLFSCALVCTLHVGTACDFEKWNFCGVKEVYFSSKPSFSLQQTWTN